MNAKEKRAARHSFEHNAKSFAEQQVDEVSTDKEGVVFHTFQCEGVPGEQGALLEKWNQWIQGYARQMKWGGLTKLVLFAVEGGHRTKLVWSLVPEFTKLEGVLTLRAEAAIVVED